jgi:hypothetical protein
MPAVLLMVVTLARVNLGIAKELLVPFILLGLEIL